MENSWPFHGSQFTPWEETKEFLLLKHPDQVLEVYHCPPLIPFNPPINRDAIVHQILIVIIVSLLDTPNINQISIQFGTQQDGAIFKPKISLYNEMHAKACTESQSIDYMRQ